jgi:DNA-binding transcriptional LysR family regulator
VYQLRKLSAAAEQLFVTQSAVSVLIRQLEQGLGTRLFDRTTRSCAHAGRARGHRGGRAGAARRGLAGRGLRDLSGLRRGRVCLAITPTLAEILLPRVVRAFGAPAPRDPGGD